MVEGERPSLEAMVRIDNSATIPLEISSRSARERANRDLLRSGGRMPPVGDNWLYIDDDGLSKKRPISHRLSPRRHLSQISFFCSELYFILLL